ncbi:uncharacterized protein LOC131930975 [Physella acuta]|uniref:uncharacterized protein LOC131930975 n=1 Tax=Physella acuta TaxID=109671 RepID=UPI0027DC7850|nr:uncharacterized protein LOC131930975 [Physella acuta]
MPYITRYHVISQTGHVLTLAGFLLHIIGVSTVYWAEDNGGNMYGIFEMCYQDLGQCYPIRVEDPTLILCQAFAVIAIVLCALSFVAILVYWCHMMLAEQRLKFYLIFSVVLGILAAASIGFCDLMFYRYIHDMKLGKSFIESGVGGVVVLTGSVVSAGFLACRPRDQYQPIN